jgi:CubicO group peptidase (beta-lactamase class C family)
MRRLGATLVCALALCAAAPPAAAAASLDDLPDSVLPGPDADYGFVVEDLATGLRVAYNERRVYPSASVYKLPLAWEVLRHVDQGALSLDEPVAILDEDGFLAAESVATKLEHVRKWPAEHWHLAFQGQLRTVSEADARLLRERIAAAAGIPA